MDFIIKRKIASHFLHVLDMYPIVTVIGPRQSGKTTLSRSLLSDWSYVSLEDPDIRSFCVNDCKGFLETYPEKAIIDEAQRVPELFSYLQTHVDSVGKNGMYVLTGSQNMQMMESISQSLAGRTSVLKLFHCRMKSNMKDRFFPLLSTSKFLPAVILVYSNLLFLRNSFIATMWIYMLNVMFAN